MTSVQIAAEFDRLGRMLGTQSKTIDTLTANLLFRTVQLDHLVSLLGAAIASSGDDKLSGVDFREVFNNAVKEKLHQCILEIGETGSPVAQHLQRILDERGILPDTYGIGTE